MCWSYDTQVSKLLNKVVLISCLNDLRHVYDTPIDYNSL